MSICGSRRPAGDQLRQPRQVTGRGTGVLELGEDVETVETGARRPREQVTGRVADRLGHGRGEADHRAAWRDALQRDAEHRPADAVDDHVERLAARLQVIEHLVGSQLGQAGGPPRDPVT